MNKKTVRNSLSSLVGLFIERENVTSRDIAEILGDYQGADAITRCRAFGMDIRPIGFVPGSRQKQIYRLENLGNYPFNYLGD